MVIALTSSGYRPGKALDVGCGNGASMWYLGSYGFDVTGIDISESAISRTREWLTKINSKGECIVGDFRALPFSDNTFDWIIDMCSIQMNSLEDIPQIFNECFRVLKPGGVLITKFRDLNSWLQPNDDSTRLSRQELTDMLKDYKVRVYEQSSWTMLQARVNICHHLMAVEK